MSNHSFGDFAETIGVCVTCGAKPCVCAYPPINYQVDAIDTGGDPPNVPGDRMTSDQAQVIEAWQAAELAIARAERAEARAQLFENALRAICTTSDSGPWIDVYREHGGGYEGLQAIAETALRSGE